MVKQDRVRTMQGLALAEQEWGNARQCSAGPGHQTQVSLVSAKSGQGREGKHKVSLVAAWQAWAATA